VSGAIMHVLFVDDEPDIRKIGKMSLELVGKMRVSTASSGEEAIRIALEEKPQVILLDVMMPELDGTATLEKMKQAGVTVFARIIFVTAKAQRTEIDAYLALGADGVIVKPFDPMTLPAEIRKIVGAIE
jgi:two-component system, OmpR family, response regulator